MILTPKPDDHENGYYCVLGSKTVHMGIHPVMYGHRVCMWVTDDSGPFANWCGGADQEHVESLYAIAKAVLERSDIDNLDRIPKFSDRKPFFYDHDFVIKISKLAGDAIAGVKLPPLHTLRNKMIERHAQLR